MTVIHNKAVRDRIPEIIEKDDKKPVVKILNDEEFLGELEKKLREEVEEYLINRKVEELIDLEEVLLRILELRHISYEEFVNRRLEKKRERGGFESNHFLIRVDVSE